MKLSDVVAGSLRIGSTRSRLEKIDEVARLLRMAPETEVVLLVSVLSGKLPEGRPGIGHATIEAVRATEGAVEAGLELRDVGDALAELRAISGPGSTEGRRRRLGELFARATAEEQDFLRRLLLEDLRQGSLEGLMLEAVAKATHVPKEEIRRAWMVSNDLGRVTVEALSRGRDGLAEVGLELLRPVQPMLAQTAEDVREALAALGRAALEHKLDGARIQAHRDGDDVRVFTRRLNDVTGSCPELVELLMEIPARRIVLDGEAIALNGDGRPHPFQVTMRRFGRRLDVESMRRALPLTVFFFDCLYLGDESLIDLAAKDRYRRMSEVLPETARVPRLVTEDPTEAERFVEEAMAAGHEGVMAKALDAPYEAGARGKSWLKVKSAHALDLVVLAAEWGSGRRRGFLSNLHLGARDPRRGGFVMLGKTFKGMTDEVLAWQTKRLLEIERGRDRYTVHVRPELVVEIACNDVQRSPHYPGGLALRFARLKGYREDKTADEADTIDAVRELYCRQTGERLGESARQLSLLPGDGET